MDFFLIFEYFGYLFEYSGMSLCCVFFGFSNIFGILGISSLLRVLDIRTDLDPLCIQKVHVFHRYFNYGFAPERNQSEPKIFKIRSKYINYYMNV